MDAFRQSETPSDKAAALVIIHTTEAEGQLFMRAIARSLHQLVKYHSTTPFSQVRSKWVEQSNEQLAILFGSRHLNADILKDAEHLAEILIASKVCVTEWEQGIMIERDSALNAFTEWIMNAHELLDRLDGSSPEEAAAKWSTIWGVSEKYFSPVLYEYMKLMWRH